MLVVINTEIIEENGQEYEVRTYSNGTVAKEIIMPEVEPSEPTEPEPTEEEIAQAEMLLMQAEILEKLNAMEV